MAKLQFRFGYRVPEDFWTGHRGAQLAGSDHGPVRKTIIDIFQQVSLPPINAGVADVL